MTTFHDVSSSSRPCGAAPAPPLPLFTAQEAV